MSSIKVVISGTEQARTNFDSSFDKVFQTCKFGLVVDTVLLPSVAADLELRYLIIISSADELRNALSSIFLKGADNEENDGSNKNAKSERFLITGCVASAQERMAIRLLVLRTTHCGICLTQERSENKDENSDRGRQIVDQIISNWNTEPKEVTSTNTIWGDASWAPEKELIIPPKWDSEGKIYAVIEANGFEKNIIEESAKLTNKNEVLAGDIPETTDQHHKNVPPNAQEWLRRHDQWLEKMAHYQLHETDEGDGDARGSENESAEHANYFQRLLSTTTNR